MQILLVLIAVVAGALLPVQAGMNVQAAKALPAGIHASLLSFIVGTMALILLCAGLRTPAPSWDRLSAMPWWAWCGGLIGATFVASAVYLSPRLGVLTFLSAAI